MPRFSGLFRILGLLAGLLWVGLPASQAASLPSTGLMGTVKSSDGKPMEGVAISARAQDKPITTSVYTNRDGEYFFPPLDAGQYRVWAQAVGFATARSEQTISSGKKIQQNFTLKSLQDIHRQLSSVEWTNSLPGDTPEDRRMKSVLNNYCTVCHLPGFVLAKRFDADGWGIILNTMVEHETAPNSINRHLVESYQEELVEYLTRVRGPKTSQMKFKALPRATGEATEIVVTEYEVPRGEMPDYVVSHNGTDWSEGLPSHYEAEVLHDAVVGKDGNVYFTDPRTPERTLGRLDPKTGRVTGYKSPDKNGSAVSAHSATTDQKGNIWVTNLTEGTILKFDPKAEQFQRFPKPSSMSRGIGTGIAVDSKGNVWATQPNGAFRLNPQTGEYTEYKAITKGGYPYGITVDSEDNAWFAQIGADRLGVVNGRTGEVTEVALAPLDEEINAKDREIGQRTGATSMAVPIDRKGPRRLGADRNGDAVWVAEFFAGRLAKIDIHTRKITEYKVPSRYSNPYTAAVDKNHMVWVPQIGSDRILKFNPFTERFTEYPLPTLGTNVRFIDVDNSTDLPAVWVPYSAVNKIARVQFRTGSAGQIAANGR